MRVKRIFASGFAMLALSIMVAFAAVAQETTVKGTMNGVVKDAQGLVVPNAKVTVEGPNGSKSVETDGEGKFSLPPMAPGFYVVKVEKQGFRTEIVKNVEVFVGRNTTVDVSLETGGRTEVVEVTAATEGVDLTSTAVGANLTDQFYSSIPIARNVASLFYTSPGVASGGGTGNANPSISGGSGLENLYLADGVNITDSAFGGLGTFTRGQGSVGSGINLSFIKEVDVKTGGFEPQYGQATGGIVQIVTKSGGSAYHGGISAYAAPEYMRATPLFRDDFRVAKIGKVLGNTATEVSGELGGYIPHFKEHLFFFGSFDPQYNHVFRATPPGAGIGPENDTRTVVLSWAAKLTYKLNEKHTVEFTGFGDPSHTNIAQQNGSLRVVNNTAFSKWEYGTKNTVARYNGTLSSTWLLNGAFRYNNNQFTEKPLADVYQIVNRTGPSPTTLQGFGFLENHDSNTFAANFDTTKVVRLWGEHSFSVGYNYENPNYDNAKRRTGPRYVVPALNAAGQPYIPAGPFNPAGKLADSQFSLRTKASCTICPLFNGIPVFLQVSRGEFGRGGIIPTEASYHAAYVNDSWTINKHVTVTAGLRWEQQQMRGTDVKYTFTDNWSPRVGFTYDPWGDRKTKIYGNFGLYSYPLPLDAAIRSLSSELDFLGTAFAPVISGGVVTPVLDQAHLISGVPGGPGNATTVFASGFDPSAGLPYFVVPGSKMTYEYEWVAGIEREYKGIQFSVRYIDRRLRRIIEDMGGVSPEGALLLNQLSVLGNPSPSLDTFVNEQQIHFNPAGPTPAGCNSTNTLDGPVADALGNVFTANSICFPNAATAGTIASDGKPDGFVKPVRHYGALEVEANRGFRNNFLVRFNYRYAHLFGNYEGAFRNDNGQTDPGISSLFDFTPGQFNLLGDQFKPGILNTDRRHVANLFFSYTLPNTRMRGLLLGTSMRAASGTPVSKFANHPIYANAGEVPLGGRGILGSTAATGSVDLKAEMPLHWGEKHTFKFGIDLFNVFNTRTIFLKDQNRDLSFQGANSNLDFFKPLQFQAPFSARVSVRYEF